MSFDPRKHAIEEHKRWMGYLQPEGVVVAPVALVDHGVQLDASTYATTQERFLASVARDAETGAPIIPHFAHFARTFLGWRDDLLDIYAVEAEVPEALRFSTGEFGELLHPDAALRSLAPSDPAKPWMLLIRQLPPGTKFDEISDAARARGWVASPAQKFERLLRAKDIPIGLMANGAEVRLLYAPRGENVGSLTFPVRSMTELAGRAVVSAFDMLLSHRRLIAVAEAARLPALLKKSREYQGAVSTALAEQVLEALYELIRGFQAADAQVDRKLLREVLARDPDEVYHALLTLLLRLVFLLFAEDRGLMPGGSLYQRNYSIHGLFEKLRAARERHPDTMDSRFGAYAQVLTLCRVVYQGSRHWDLAMPARHGHLFDPDRFPFLEGRSHAHDDPGPDTHQLPLVSDGTLHRVLEKLLLLDGERLSYRALDVEQIGSVYQTMIGFTMDVAQGTSIALKPAKPKGAPAFINLDQLLALDGAKRAELLQKTTDHKLTGNAANALKNARTHDDLLAALDRKIARAASRDKVPAGSLILQPTDERRRSGSHYTPRALTAPIVRKTLEPILARLCEHPTAQQILDLKVCDPAVGSGAFLVEACRQLGDALVAAWQYYGGKPAIPPDEDELLHARRLVAQRCLYGVDRNPMATDLAKLSLWLATLAKDHPFTFLDHAIRCGDALVGLTRKQIECFHWNENLDEAKQTLLFAKEVTNRTTGALRERTALLAVGDDFTSPQLKREKLEKADELLNTVRAIGDAAIAAFFSADKDKAREQKRVDLAERFAANLKGDVRQRPTAEIDALRGGPFPVIPFHWEIEFPEVFARENGGFDAFVGNPPFAGRSTLYGSNHLRYIEWLQATHEQSHGNADLVAHFFRRAFVLSRHSGCSGLIATNTIGQGDTRTTGLRWICLNGGTIYAARKRYKWPGEAAVVVSVIWISNGKFEGPVELDGQPVEQITAYLFKGGTNDSPTVLTANESKSFQGCVVVGMGFTFDDTDAKGIASPLADMSALVAKNPKNAERIFPFIGGEELNEHPQQRNHRFIINFGDRTEADARANYPDLMRIVEERVKPERQKQGARLSPDQQKRADRWWQYSRTAKDLYDTTRGSSRVLALSQVTAQFAFAFLPANWVFSHALNVFAFEQDSAFALLQSRAHEVWARFFGSSLEDRLRYTGSDCFETFPFPAGWETNAALEAAGREYYEARAALMIANNEGLTKTYNRFHDPAEDAPGIQNLRKLHAALDHAVLAAYGWSDLVEAGRCACEFLPDYYDEPEQEGGEPIPRSIRFRWPDATRDEVLARLLKLNSERAAQEKKAQVAAALDGKMSAAPKRVRASNSRKAAPLKRELINPPQSELFA
ncbi:MAG: DNA methyltransferase [Verrucomicrobiota bacterium]|jgi:hypothetical protein